MNLFCTQNVILKKNVQSLIKKKNVMKISGIVEPQPLNGPCGIPIEKRNDILNN